MKTKHAVESGPTDEELSEEERWFAERTGGAPRGDGEQQEQLRSA
jgi:hypothetical protein